MSDQSLEIKRGDIYIANLNDTKKEHTSKQMGIRPVCIIQNDVGNKYSPTVIVASITSKTNKRKLPTHVDLTSKECGLNRESLILLEQISTIDKSDLINKLGKASKKEMKEMDKALMISGGIDLDRLIQQEKPIFNLLKAKKIVEDIEELDEYILTYKPKKVEVLLKQRKSQINNLIEYCNSYGVDYNKFYNARAIENMLNRNLDINRGDGVLAYTV